jgi:hypothetical protein
VAAAPTFSTPSASSSGATALIPPSLPLPSTFLWAQPRSNVPQRYPISHLQNVLPVAPLFFGNVYVESAYSTADMRAGGSWGALRQAQQTHLVLLVALLLCVQFHLLSPLPSPSVRLFARSLCHTLFAACALLSVAGCLSYTLAAQEAHQCMGSHCDLLFVCLSLCASGPSNGRCSSSAHARRCPRSQLQHNDRSGTEEEDGNAASVS